MMMVKKKATGTIFDRCSLVDDRAAVRALSVAGLSDNPAPLRAEGMVRPCPRVAGGIKHDPSPSATPEHGPPQTERTVYSVVGERGLPVRTPAVHGHDLPSKDRAGSRQ